MSIRLRLTLWYVALLSGTLMLFGAALYASVRYSLYNEVNRTLDLHASAVEESVQFYLRTGEQAILQGEDREIPFRPPPTDALARPDIFVQWRLLNGGTVEASSNLAGRDLPLPDFVLAQVQQGETLYLRAELDDEPVTILTKPIFFEGEVTALVQVARSLEDIEKTLQQLLFFIITGTALTLVVTAAVGAWLAERALEPVDDITEAALRISRAEDLSRRLPPYALKDEIGRLIAAFNEMLARLDDVFRDQQRFVADVSHELRTPLTALQGNIDLLKRGAFESRVERQEALDTIESEVARLNRLVADLLLLARMEGGESLTWEPVELDTLLLEVFRHARLLANNSEHPIRIRLGHEDQATVLGDPDRLKQLFLNLVDNAVKYTPEGEVVLSLWKDEANREVRITVEDTGVGIPEAALPFLFRRFYRADKARTREPGGTGLGLAIAKWIVQGHGGSIDVDSEEGKGTTFTVVLPLPAPEELSRAQVSTGSYRAVAPVR